MDAITYDYNRVRIMALRINTHVGAEILNELMEENLVFCKTSFNLEWKLNGIAIGRMLRNNVGIQMSKLTPRYQDIDNFTKQFFLRQDSRKCSPKTGFLNLIGTVFGSSPWQHYFFNRFVVQYKKGENNHSAWFYTEQTFEKKLHGTCFWSCEHGA